MWVSSLFFGGCRGLRIGFGFGWLGGVDVDFDWMGCDGAAGYKIDRFVGLLADFGGVDWHCSDCFATALGCSCCSAVCCWTGYNCYCFGFDDSDCLRSAPSHCLICHYCLGGCQCGCYCLGEGLCRDSCYDVTM